MLSRMDKTKNVQKFILFLNYTYRSLEMIIFLDFFFFSFDVDLSPILEPRTWSTTITSRCKKRPNRRKDSQEAELWYTELDDRTIQHTKFQNIHALLSLPGQKMVPRIRFLHFSLLLAIIAEKYRHKYILLNCTRK